MVFEAGCREKDWIYNDDGNAERYNLIASGTLLERRVCINKNYRKYFAPHGQNTKVHTTIEYHQVRDVDAKKQTVSIDLLLTLRWLDPNIMTNFNEQDKKQYGLILRPEKLDKIWIPDLYIWNQTSLKTKNEWARLKTSKILTTKKIKEKEDTYSKTTVEMKYEIKTSIYCKFEFSAYPMDAQNCSVKIGSGSEGAIFILYDEGKMYHASKRYRAVGLNLDIGFFGEGNRETNNSVGFHIQMNRLLSPFFLKF